MNTRQASGVWQVLKAHGADHPVANLTAGDSDGRRGTHFSFKCLFFT